MANKKTLADRFWAKVVKSDGCWKWIGTKHQFGYGMIRDEQSIKITASRASWLIHFGEIPEGMYICHHCDNPECTNPEHLFLGTPSDNNNDKEKKGRGTRTLNQDQNDAIATLVHAAVPHRTIARAFKIDRNQIFVAMKYGVVQHTPYSPPANPKPKSPPPKFKGQDSPRAKLNDADVFRIRELRSQGLSYSKIAKEYPVSQSMIAHICLRRSWTHI